MKAKLILKDQVTVKIEGLDPATRRKLYQKYSIVVPYARHVAAFKLGRWDGKQHYFSMGGSTYLNLLPEILPILVDDGYDIDIVDNRQYYSFNFGLIDEDVFSHVSWPKGHPEENTSVKLRDYQIEAVNSFIQNPQSLQSITTSGGKCLTGDTQLNLILDPKTSFGQFMINKLQQREAASDVTRNPEIGKK